MAHSKSTKSKRTASNGRKGARRGSKRPITVGDLMSFHGVSDPNVSPDGEAILFTKKHIGEKNKEVANLWIVPTSGGETRQFSSGRKDGHGRWSSDGTRIAFISGRDEARPNIFTMPLDGGEAVALTDFPEGKIGSFRWSPDGKWIAFSGRPGKETWGDRKSVV